MCVTLSISVCMLIVSITLLMFDAAVIVRYGASFWLKPVVILMQYM